VAYVVLLALPRIPRPEDLIEPAVDQLRITLAPLSCHIGHEFSRLFARC